MAAPLYVRRRSSYAKTLDDIPTPPWVTRAFVERVLIPAHGPLNRNTACEPAAGRGHMLKTLAEYFGRRNVYGADVKDYGKQVVWSGRPIEIKDFRTGSPTPRSYYVTNPPFKLVEECLHYMLAGATHGVGLYCKTLFLEGEGRYRRIFDKTRPTRVMVLSRRMPGKKRRIVREAPAYLSHAWFWWDKLDSELGRRPTVFDWFPPETQRLYERDEDYT